MADINTKTSKGLLGTKVGMTQVWNEDGKLIPVTVIEVAPNVVTQVRTPEKDGYNAIQIAAGADRPAQGHQAPRRPLRGRRCHAASPPHGDPHR